MQLKIIPLEERILLDAAVVASIASAPIAHHHDDAMAHAQQQNAVNNANNSTDHSGPATVHDMIMTPPPNDKAMVNVLVISREVHDANVLAAAAKPGVKVVMYDPNTPLQKLAQQIENALNGKKADSIAFAANGTKGSFQLTNDEIVNQTTLQKDPAIQAFWKNVAQDLTKHGEVNILSCNVAGSQDGLSLIANLDTIIDSNGSHATVDASTGLVGNPAEGGSWVLQVGHVNAAKMYFDPALLSKWTGNLDLPTISSPLQVFTTQGPDFHALHVSISDSSSTNPNETVVISSSSANISLGIGPNSSHANIQHVGKGPPTIIISGDLNDVNQALGALQFSSAYASSGTIHISVTDGTGSSVVQTITVNTPAVTSPGTGFDFAPGSITVDNAVVSGQEQVTLEAHNGSMSFLGIIDSSLFQGGVDSIKDVINGTPDQIDHLLGQLAFTPNTALYLADQVGISVVSVDANGGSANGFVPVSVFPSVIFANQGVPLAFQGNDLLSISGNSTTNETVLLTPSSQQMTLSLGANLPSSNSAHITYGNSGSNGGSGGGSGGKVPIGKAPIGKDTPPPPTGKGAPPGGSRGGGGSPGPSVSGSPSPGGALTISGSLHDVNQIMGLLQFSSNAAGANTISITTTDDSGHAINQAVTVNVLPDVIANGSSTFAFAQGTITDNSNLNGTNERVSLTPSDGIIGFSNPGLINGPQITDNPDGSITLTGSSSFIDNALSVLTFTPNSALFSSTNPVVTNPIGITISSQDLGNEIASGFIPVSVMPSMLFAHTGSTVTFQGNNAIYISDGNSSNENVTISVPSNLNYLNGVSLLLGSNNSTGGDATKGGGGGVKDTGGGDVTKGGGGGGSNTSQSISGTLSQIDQQLSTLQLALGTVTGPVPLSIQTRDASGVMILNQQTISVNVLPVLSANANSTLVFGANSQGSSNVSVDNANLNGIEKVTLTPENGNISFIEFNNSGGNTGGITKGGIPFPPPGPGKEGKGGIPFPPPGPGKGGNGGLNGLPIAYDLSQLPLTNPPTIVNSDGSSMLFQKGQSVFSGQGGQGDQGQRLVLQGTAQTIDLALSKLAFSPTGNEVNLFVNGQINIVVNDLGNAGDSLSPQSYRSFIDVSLDPSIIQNVPTTIMSGDYTTPIFINPFLKILDDQLSSNQGQITENVFLNATSGTFNINMQNLQNILGAYGGTVTGNNTNELSITAPINYLQTFLSPIFYTQSTSQSSATITMNVNDSNHTFFGTTESGSTSFQIVDAQNAISGTPAEFAFANESFQTPFQISTQSRINSFVVSTTEGNLSITDPIAGVTKDPTININLTALSNFGNLTSSEVEKTANGILNTLTFTPDPGFTGPVTIVLDANIGTSEPVDVLKTVTLNVLPPRGTQTALTIDANSTIKFNGLVTANNDAVSTETVTVVPTMVTVDGVTQHSGTITYDQGLINSLSQKGLLSFSYNSDGSESLTGNPTMIDQVLSTLQYTPIVSGTSTLKQFFGAEILVGNYTTTDDIGYIIINTNNTPIIANAPSEILSNDAQFPLFQPNNITINDSPTKTTPFGANETVTISTDSGTLSGAYASGRGYESGKTISFSGDLPNVDSALNNVLFMPDPMANTPAYITITATDNGYNTSSGITESGTTTFTAGLAGPGIGITVGQNNQSLSEQFVNENGTLTFGNNNNDLIQLGANSLSANSNAPSITLSATEGVFGLPAFQVAQATSVTFSNSSVSNINKDLSGLTFTPTPGFVGSTPIYIGVNSSLSNNSEIVKTLTVNVLPSLTMDQHATVTFDAGTVDNLAQPSSPSSGLFVPRGPIPTPVFGHNSISIGDNSSLSSVTVSSPDGLLGGIQGQENVTLHGSGYFGSNALETINSVSRNLETVTLKTWPSVFQQLSILSSFDGRFSGVTVTSNPNDNSVILRGPTYGVGQVLTQLEQSGWEIINFAGGLTNVTPNFNPDGSLSLIGPSQAIGAAFSTLQFSGGPPGAYPTLASTITIDGSLVSNINSELSGLTFVATPAFSGPAPIYIGANLRNNSEIVNILSVDVGTQNNVPSYNETVDLSVPTGSFQLTNVPVFDSSGNLVSYTNLELTGTQTAIDQALQGFQYNTPATGSSTQIAFSVTDTQGNPISNAGSLPISFTGVSDIAGGPSSIVVGRYNGPLFLANPITINDVFASKASDYNPILRNNEQVTVSLLQADGKTPSQDAYLSVVARGNFQILQQNFNNQYQSITFEGTPSGVSEGLRDLFLTQTVGASDTSDLAFVNVSSSSFFHNSHTISEPPVETATKSISVSVPPVNGFAFSIDQPQVFVTENLSSMNLSGLTLSDVGSTTQLTDILSSTIGTFNSKQGAVSSLTLTGSSLSDLNKIISTLSFVPTPGATGSGPIVEDVQVNHTDYLNTEMVNILPSIGIHEGSNVQWSPSSLTADTGSSNGIETVTLNTHGNGTLSFSRDLSYLSRSGLTTPPAFDFAIPNQMLHVPYPIQYPINYPIQYTTVALTGPPSLIDIALNALVYTPAPGVPNNGIAPVQITVDTSHGYAYTLNTNGNGTISFGQDLSQIDPGLKTVISGQSIELIGSPALVDQALQVLVFTPSQNYTPSDSAPEQISITTANARGNIDVSVIAPPLLGVSPSLPPISINENSAVLFDNGAIKLDSTFLTLSPGSATITPVNGTISIIQGLIPSPDGNNYYFYNGSLHIFGDSSSFNAVLNALVFTPNPGFVGQAGFFAYNTNRGNNIYQVNESTAQFIPINVSGTASYITAPSSLGSSGSGEGFLSGYLFNQNPIKLVDPGNGGDVLVTLQGNFANSGSFTVDSNVPKDVTINSSGATLTLKGPLADVTEALNHDVQANIVPSTLSIVGLNAVDIPGLTNEIALVAQPIGGAAQVGVLPRGVSFNFHGTNFIPLIGPPDPVVDAFNHDITFTPNDSSLSISAAFDIPKNQPGYSEIDSTTINLGSISAPSPAYPISSAFPFSQNEAWYISNSNGTIGTIGSTTIHIITGPGEYTIESSGKLAIVSISKVGSLYGSNDIQITQYDQENNNTTTQTDTYTGVGLQVVISPNATQSEINSLLNTLTLLPRYSQNQNSPLGLMVSNDSTHINDSYILINTQQIPEFSILGNFIEGKNGTWHIPTWHTSSSFIFPTNVITNTDYHVSIGTTLPGGIGQKTLPKGAYDTLILQIPGSLTTKGNIASLNIDPIFLNNLDPVMNIDLSNGTSVTASGTAADGQTIYTISGQTINFSGLSPTVANEIMNNLTVTPPLNIDQPGPQIIVQGFSGTNFSDLSQPLFTQTIEGTNIITNTSSSFITGSTAGLGNPGLPPLIPVGNGGPGPGDLSNTILAYSPSQLRSFLTSEAAPVNVSTDFSKISNSVDVTLENAQLGKAINGGGETAIGRAAFGIETAQQASAAANASTSEHNALITLNNEMGSLNLKSIADYLKNLDFLTSTSSITAQTNPNNVAPIQGGEVYHNWLSSDIVGLPFNTLLAINGAITISSHDENKDVDVEEAEFHHGFFEREIALMASDTHSHGEVYVLIAKVLGIDDNVSYVTSQPNEILINEIKAA